jgi:hypothetical protein
MSVCVVGLGCDYGFFNSWRIIEYDQKEQFCDQKKVRL